jgi:hypothetical protein
LNLNAQTTFDMEIQEAVRQVRPGWRRKALQGGVCQHDDERPQVDHLQDLLLNDPHLCQQDSSFNPSMNSSVTPDHLQDLFLIIINKASSFSPIVFLYEFSVAPDHL